VPFLSRIFGGGDQAVVTCHGTDSYIGRATVGVRASCVVVITVCASLTGQLNRCIETTETTSGFASCLYIINFVGLPPLVNIVKCLFMNMYI
jgi:hypothetical protein